MKFLAVYFAVICIVFTVYSVNGEKHQPDATPAKKPLPKRQLTGNHVPEYDDQFPDFPRTPEEALTEIFNSPPIIPLWIVNPLYYVFEVVTRGIAYLINPY
ncbi:unnamed protein product [Trichobilharzia szidati]|nr:unnamed protein product [Trichobilharzia szidati]